MSEPLFTRVFTPAELTAGPHEVNIPFPPGVLTPWAVIAVPVDGGGNPAVDIVIQRVDAEQVGALVASTPLVDNQSNVFQRTDVVNRIRVTLTPGVTPPDGGLTLRLLGSRLQA